MWNLKSIEAKDFLSYKEMELGIKPKETTLIYGKNLTDKGVASNGSGKSSILEVLCFGLTGNSLRKVKNKELIRNGEGVATITVSVENPVIPMTLRIVRTIDEKKASTVRLYENDTLREDLMDLKPKETDKVILEHLEISYNDIVNYYLISKEKYASLLLSSDTQKKEVINRFSKADYIDAVFPKIDQDIEMQEGATVKYTGIKDGCLSKIELLTEQIEALKEKDVDAEKQERIQKIKASIDTKMGEIESEIKNEQEAGQKVEGHEDKKKKLTSSLEKLVGVEKLNQEVNDLEGKEKDLFLNFKEEENDNYLGPISDVQDIIKRGRIDIQECDDLLKSSNTTLATLRKIEMGEIECPACKHTFLVGDQELTLEECKEKIVQETEVIELIESDKKEKQNTLEESEGLLKELQKELGAFREKYNTKTQGLNNEIAEKRRKIGEVDKEKSEIESQIRGCDNFIDLEQRKQDRANNVITSLQDEIKEHERKIGEVEKEANPITKQIKELSGQIKAQEKVIADNAKDLEKEQDKLDELKEWKMNFKRFKSFLANQSLTLIEQQANHFLDKMKCDNRVRIDGFRELANGKMKEEIAIEISRDSLTTESFGKFSGGEKAKVDLSCILAMQTLINTSCKNGGLDLLFCDEILESADETAMNSIATSLSYVDKTVFMISQNQPNVDCNMLEVKKENKISNIISYG